MHRSLLLLCCTITCQIYAQQVLTGKIYDKESDSVIAGAIISNKNTRETVVSDKQGVYSIPAREGNIIVFSAIGHTPDTLITEAWMFQTVIDRTLSFKELVLGEVKLAPGTYAYDSLQRRNEYRFLYEQKIPGITGGNRPSSGFGISLSPLSYFSSAAKQKRKLKKRLEAREREDYVDHRFSMALVGRITGLKGDTLSVFMYKYRPSWEFCRKANQENMILYINDKFREFRKPVE